MGLSMGRAGIPPSLASFSISLQNQLFPCVVTVTNLIKWIHNTKVSMTLITVRCQDDPLYLRLNLKTYHCHSSKAFLVKMRKCNKAVI